MQTELARQLDALVQSVQSNWLNLAWSLGVIITALLAGHIAARLSIRLIRRRSARTHTRLDDAISEHLSQPLRWLLPLAILGLSIQLLAVSEEVIEFLRHITLVGSLISGGWVLIRSVRVVEDVVNARLDIGATDNLRARAIATQMRGFRNITTFLLILLTLGTTLMTFEAVQEVGGTLLASAGVAGLVVGFAAQRTIATVLAGIQIALTQPIRVDDVVIVEGEWGRIEELTLTYVVVRIWDLRRLIVPINYFIEKPFQNWTRISTDLLGTVELYLDYSVPVEAIRKELERILHQSPEWDQKTWNVQVTATTERSMTVRALFSTRNASDQWTLRCTVREGLIRFVQKNYPDALPRVRAELNETPSISSVETSTA